MIALAYATRVPSAPELLDLGKARFIAELDAVVAVYAAAMRPPHVQLAGRRAIMERHASHPSFHAVAVTAGTGGRHRDGPPGSRPQPHGAPQEQHSLNVGVGVMPASGDANPLQRCSS